MAHRTHRVALLLALSCVVYAGTLATTGAQTSQIDEAIAEGGRAITMMFYEGKLDDTWNASSEQFTAAIKSVDALRDVRPKVIAGIGKETQVVSERTSTQGELNVYQRVARFEKAVETRIIVQCVWDKSGVIQGFPSGPSSNSPKGPWKSKADWSLPSAPPLSVAPA